MTVIHHAIKALPVVLKPVEDELLSSWISRHAEYYGVKPLAMLRHCISDAPSLRSKDRRLSAEDGIRLGHIFHSLPANIRRMTHADVPQSAIWLLASKPIQSCLECAEKNAQTDASRTILKSCFEGWRITCPVCGSKLFEVSGENAQRPQEAATPFPELWEQALHGQRLFDDAIIHNKWPWASPIYIFRMLLVRRLCKAAYPHDAFDYGRTANLIVSGFDETVQRLGLEVPRGTRRIVPMSIRPSLLAAVSTVIARGPDAITNLFEATIGGYRLRFDKLASQMQAEIRGRQTISQLLPS
jgi:hypothetical protein